MLYLTFILLARYDPAHPVLTVHEYVFWAWTAARAVGELSELEQFNSTETFGRSLRLYWIDVWNQLDVFTALIVLLIMILRCLYAPSDDGSVPDIYPAVPEPTSDLQYSGMDQT
eukprot:229270-Prymnesium_polylepis.2